MTEENKTDEPVQCPVCLEEVDQDELDMFGGICESCNEEIQEEESE